MAAAPKQVQAAYGLMKQPPKYELYDLQEDPFEFKNLAQDPAHAKTLGRLRAELTSWQKRTGDALLDPVMAQKLFSMIREAGASKRQALGYKSFMQIR